MPTLQLNTLSVALVPLQSAELPHVVAFVGVFDAHTLVPLFSSKKHHSPETQSVAAVSGVHASPEVVHWKPLHTPLEQVPHAI